MADMRKVAGELLGIALLQRYGSSSTTNDLRRAMGKINNGNRSVTAVSVVVAQLKATALGCSKW
jgi:hypothetical protein